MAKMESTFKNMLLVLTGITLVAALLLGSVYVVTQEPIRQADMNKQLAAIQEVAPAFDNEPMQEMMMVSVPDGDSLEVYPTRKGEELTGLVVKSFTNRGFNGEIAVMVGFDAKGTIEGYSVIKHAETPGLGSKMQEWFSNSANQKQCVVGRQMGSTPLRVSKDAGGDVDAITAATITSRAFLHAVNTAYQAFLSYQSMQSVADTTAVEAEVK